MGESRTFPPSRTSVPAASAALVREPKWDLLLMCLAAYIANAVGKVQELFPVLIPLRLSIVTGVGAIALYLLHQTGPRRINTLRSRTTTAILLLLVWATLSVPGALNRGVAFFSLIDAFVKAVLLYLLIVGTVRGVRDVERLALVYYAAATLYAAVILLRFDLSGDWRLGELYYYDANDFATLAVTAMPLGLYFSVRRGRPVQRIMSALGLPLLCVAFVRSGSRGGFLAMLAVALYMLFGYTTVRAKWRVAATAAIAVVLLATASDRYWTQMQTIFSSEQDYNRTAESGRMATWGRGIGYMFQHPVLGVGLDNFPVAEGTISPFAWRQQFNIGVQWKQAHNTFIQVGAELGLPGLVLFLTFLGGAFGALRRAARRQPAPQVAGHELTPLAQALIASLVGFVVGAFFLSLAYQAMLYTLVGLAAGLGKVVLWRPRMATISQVSVRTITGPQLGAALPIAGPRPPR